MAYVFDTMFQDDEAIRLYMGGKYHGSEKGRTNKANGYFRDRIVKINRDFSKLTFQLSVCRNVLEDAAAESGADVRYRVRTIWRMIQSFTENRKFYSALYGRLSEWLVPDKRLVGALRRAMEKSEERISRIRRVFLPEYFELCGLDGYAQKLEEGGSSIEKDISAFFSGYGKPEQGASPAEKAAHYARLASLYRAHAEEEMRRMGVEKTDPSGRIRAENEAAEERRRKAKEEERAERDRANAELARAKLDAIFARLSSAFERGGRTAGPLFTVNEVMISRATREAAGADAAWVVGVGIPGRTRGSARAVFLREKGGALEPQASPSAGTMAVFAGDGGEERARQAARQAEEEHPGWIAEACRLELYPTRPDHMVDEFGNYSVKRYKIQKNGRSLADAYGRARRALDLLQAAVSGAGSPDGDASPGDVQLLSGIERYNAGANRAQALRERAEELAMDGKGAYAVAVAKATVFDRGDERISIRFVPEGADPERIRAKKMEGLTRPISRVKLFPGPPDGELLEAIEAAFPEGGPAAGELDYSAKAYATRILNLSSEDVLEAMDSARERLVERLVAQGDGAAQSAAEGFAAYAGMLTAKRLPGEPGALRESFARSVSPRSALRMMIAARRSPAALALLAEERAVSWDGKPRIRFLKRTEEGTEEGWAADEGFLMPTEEAEAAARERLKERRGNGWNPVVIQVTGKGFSVYSPAK